MRLLPGPRPYVALAAIILINFLSTCAAMANHLRLSLAEASKLYRQHVFKYKPTMNPAVVFSLSEETSPDLWERLSAQMFRVHGQPNEGEVILIKNDQLITMIPGFSGVGPGSMCVADLEDNGRPELIYTFSWGSGIPYSSVSVVYEHNGKLASCKAITCKFGNLTIKKQDEKTVSVELDNTRVGNVSGKSSERFMVKIGNIPEKLKEKIVELK